MWANLKNPRTACIEVVTEDGMSPGEASPARSGVIAISRRLCCSIMLGWERALAAYDE
ncbi:MAG: hypothetical protein ACRDPG_02615 [Nocardioidaceae bacterium]